MNAPGVSDSRFHMWRAVFAMAHADNMVTDSERSFMANYIAHVPFSDEQKKILRADIDAPQPVGEMLTRVTEPEDRGAFFQFSEMLVWCDGDYDDTEADKVERILDEQMKRFNLDAIYADMKRERTVAQALAEAAYNDMQAEAKEQLGLEGIIRRIFKK